MSRARAAALCRWERGPGRENEAADSLPFLLAPVSVDRTNYKIQIPLPPKIDPSVTMMQVEEKPDVTYSDVGGCKEQIEKLREVVELPLLEVRPPASGPLST